MQLLVISFLAICVFSSVHGNMTEYIRSKMLTFPSYVSSQWSNSAVYLEAKPFSHLNPLISFYLDTHLSNVTVSGFTNFKTTSIDATYFSGGSFRLNLNARLKAQGYHVSSWSLFSKNSSNSGTWTAGYIAAELGCGVRFELLRTKAINVTEASCGIYWTFDTKNIYFQGISQTQTTADYTMFMDPAFTYCINAYLYQVQFPYAKLFEKFWKDIFSKTTLQELNRYMDSYLLTL